MSSVENHTIPHIRNHKAHHTVAMKNTYCLEVAIRRLHGLPASPTIDPAAAWGGPIVVQFLDFPGIIITPQPSAPNRNDNRTAAPEEPGSVAYNICHTAVFTQEATVLEGQLPTNCTCFFRNSPKKQWLCPCPLTPSKPAPPHLLFVTCVARHTDTGAATGQIDMYCCVYPSGDSGTSAVASYSPAGAAVPTNNTATPPMQLVPQSTVAKPYIVRVVIDGQHEGRARKQRTTGSPTTLQQLREGVQHPRGSLSSSCLPCADESTFLYVLQYDIAYQLQSTSEFLATTLKHEGNQLGAVTLKRRNNDLTMSIDKHVKRIIRLANIVLQIANQLLCSRGTFTAGTGTTRRLDGEEVFKRQPVNKLHMPKEGTVAHYAMYDVLFQIQCVGANLAYTVAAHRKALEVPLHTLPPEHVAFCRQLENEVQLLTRKVNIMIQTAMAGRVRGGSSQVPPAAAVELKNKKKAHSPISSRSSTRTAVHSSLTSNQSSSYSSRRSGRSRRSSSSDEKSSRPSGSSISSHPLSSPRGVPPSPRRVVTPRSVAPPPPPPSRPRSPVPTPVVPISTATAPLSASPTPQPLTTAPTNYVAFAHPLASSNTQSRYTADSPMTPLHNLPVTAVPAQVVGVPPTTLNTTFSALIPDPPAPMTPALSMSLQSSPPFGTTALDSATTFFATPQPTVPQPGTTSTAQASAPPASAAGASSTSVSPPPLPPPISQALLRPSVMSLPSPTAPAPAPKPSVEPSVVTSIFSKPSELVDQL